MSFTTIVGDETDSLKSWLSKLRTLLPPEGLAHIGAGSGSDLPDYANWGLTELILLDADEERAKSLAEMARQHANWHSYHKLIGQFDGEAVFHLTSNPRENGLLPAQSQKAIWRNIQSRGQCAMQSSSLDTLIPQDSQSKVNWLLVDCLPAAALLRGAQRLLDQCDVVLVRVLLPSQTLLKGDAEGCSIEEVCELLANRGYRHVVTSEERMPLLGQALFVRNFGSQRLETIKRLKGAEAKVAALARSHENLTSEITKLLEESTEHQKLAQEFNNVKVQLELANQARNEQTAEAAHQHVAAEARIISLQGQLSAMEGERNQLLVSCASNAAQLELLQIQLEESRRKTLEAERAVAAIAERVAAHDADASILKSHCASFEELNESLQRSLSERNARTEQLEALEEELRNLEQCRKSLGNSNEVLRQSLTEHQHRIDNLETEKKELQGNMASTFNHAQFADRERERLASELESKLNRLAEDESQIARMKHELSSQTNEIQRLQTQLRNEEKARLQFSIEMARAQAQVALIRDVLLRPASQNSPIIDEKR